MGRNQLSSDDKYKYISKSLAELILQSCNNSCGKPSDYSYILEFQSVDIIAKVAPTITLFDLSAM